MSRRDCESEMPASSEPPRYEQVGHLLIYSPDYGIIICKSCGFAIQPKALSGHLLRHHIYRDRRRMILDQVAELTLLDPEQVRRPATDINPFPHLPVTAGYRCNISTNSACNHLCVSQKRMSQHLRELHGSPLASGGRDNSQRVYLQTFFKGSQVRYFEVKPNAESLASPNSSLKQPFRCQFLDLPYGSKNESSPTPCTNEESQVAEQVPMMPIQMQNLMYLHHYNTITGFSLSRGTDSTAFWIHDLPLQASLQPFLMHGILAVAAFHQALTAASPVDRRLHHSAGLQHQSAGLATFRGIIDCPTAQTSTALTAFARLLGVQFCAQALFESQGYSARDYGNEQPRISRILEFLSLLRGGLDLLLNMQDLLPPGSPLNLSVEILQGLGDLEISPEAFHSSAPYLVNELWTRLQVSQNNSTPNGLASVPGNLDSLRHLIELCVIASKVSNSQAVTESLFTDAIPSSLGMVNSVQRFTEVLAESFEAATMSYRRDQQNPHPTPCPPLLCYPHIPQTTYAMLVTLPSRIVAKIGKPDPLDLRAFDLAMAALISSFSRSHASDTVWARWNGIESWPRMLPDQFLDMIEATNPLALVLVAHWCVLLSRQENHYWFLRGQSERMFNIVLANLDVTMQEFVQSCIAPLS